MRVELTMDATEFERGIAAGFEEYRLDADAFCVHVADKVKGLAVALAPVLKAPTRERTPGELRASIVATPLLRDARGPFVAIGTSISWAKYVEFGTHKMAPRPFLRPAFASAASALGALGSAVGPGGVGTAKRMAARAKLRRAVRRGQMTSAEARKASRTISLTMRSRTRRRQ